jgi:hypothetical protein
MVKYKTLELCKIAVQQKYSIGYKNQLDNMNKQLLDKENKMISIHNKQIQNLTIKHNKQIEE